ncbi:MAG: ABC transporter permease [Acidimicrobiia bacterium]|nr:ABC transporter permease [Acidimicrobiia bacterium]
MFVGLRDLWVAKGRFVLMTSVVGLVALLVVMLSGLTAGLANQNISAVEGLDADFVGFQVSTDGPSYDQSRIDIATVDAWRGEPGVRDAAPLGISRANMTVSDSSVPVVVFGAPSGSFLAPAGLGGSGSVVVDASFASAHGLTDGDRVTVGDQTESITVVPGEAYFAHSPVVWMDIAAWQHLTGNEGVASVVALATNNDFDPSVPLEGFVVEPTDATFGSIGSFTAENGSLQMIRGFLLVISALVIGAFFTVWTIQRRHDIAVLKAMGASTPYLLKDALGQALIVLGAAAIVGGGVGLAVGAVVAGTVPFVSDLATTLYPLAVMVVIGLIGAALAVRSITNVDPLTALGGTR